MEESVDVVDEDDVKTGVATRREVHMNGTLHRGVHVLLRGSKGILLQRRSSKKSSFPRFLDLSVSEHVKEGETFDQAARRGLREELGIRRVALKRMAKLRMTYMPGDNMVSVIYRARFDSKVKLDPAEVEEVMTMRKGELTTLVEQEGEKLAPWARQLLRWHLKLPSAVEEIG